MKIAFVTIGNTRDIKRGSGTPYHIWQELLRQGHTVHLVGPLIIKTPLLTRFFKWLSTRMGKRYLSYRDPFVGRTLGKAANSILAELDVDVVLTNDYCLAGYTQTDKSIVLYTDAFFPRDYRENTHPWLTNLSFFSVFFCQKTTELGLKRASLCVFASQFVLEEAQKYSIAKGKPLFVVPYGANITEPEHLPSRTIQTIQKKGHIDILFVGKDWELKGGDIAVKVIYLLNKRVFPAHLHIVGVELQNQYHNNFLEFYGLLSKDILAERKKLENLFLTCDVLLVPSKAEGYGLVFVEAAAYGLPSLAFAVGGTTTSVGLNNSETLFDLSNTEEDFVSVIERWFSCPEEYEKISKSVYQNYVEEKNWRVSVSRLILLIDSIRNEQTFDIPS